MRRRGRIVMSLAAVAVGIVLPGPASAHAYLIKTVAAVLIAILLLKGALA